MLTQAIIKRPIKPRNPILCFTSYLLPIGAMDIAGTLRYKNETVMQRLGSHSLTVYFRQDFLQ